MASLCLLLHQSFPALAIVTVPCVSSVGIMRYVLCINMLKTLCRHCSRFTLPLLVWSFGFGLLHAQHGAQASAKMQEKHSVLYLFVPLMLTVNTTVTAHKITITTIQGSVLAGGQAVSAIFQHTPTTTSYLRLQGGARISICYHSSMRGFSQTQRKLPNTMYKRTCSTSKVG